MLAKGLYPLGERHGLWQSGRVITTSPQLRPIALVVLDLAGTTVADPGLTEIAYTSALHAPDAGPGDPELQRMLDHVRATMGEPVDSVLRHLLDDNARAQAGLKSFDACYAEFADAGRLVALPGAAHAIGSLRESGIRVALTTGFSPTTRDCILHALGWQDIADLTVCADESQPNSTLAAAAALDVAAPALIATVGDTAFDMRCGRQAGGTFVAGVLTGAHDGRTLQAAGASHLLQAAMSLPEFITPAGR
jgi:phosphoglycolate phosphatase